MRDLVLVLGDQLDMDAAAFDGFDPAQDAVWMAEVGEESTHVWSSQLRIALFLAAMRHVAAALRDAGRPLHYRRLDDPATRASLAEQLAADIAALRPRRLPRSRACTGTSCCATRPGWPPTRAWPGPAASRPPVRCRARAHPRRGRLIRARSRDGDAG